MNKRLLLVDHNALLHRCRNALLKTGRKYTTSEGIPTTGVFSYLNSLLSIIEQQSPSHVIVCFDAGGNSRKEESEDYKANRAPLDPEFMCESRILLNEALYAMGIESVGLRGYEADDLLHTFAHCAQYGKERFEEVIIATVDQDLLQCVSDRCAVLLWNGVKKQQMMWVNDVLEKWDCSPADICMIKALSGDSSDNIKGIPGIGKKTAIKIFKECQGNPGAILEHKKVREHAKTLGKNLELIRLRFCAEPLGDLCWGDYELGKGMLHDWTELLEKYELSSIAKRLNKTKVVLGLRELAEPEPSLIAR